VISTKMSATQWLASACRDAVRLADGPAKLRQPISARNQETAFAARAHLSAAALSAPVYRAGAEVPTQPFAKGGMRGPQPWRDKPVIT
jgi:hypothetical protein